MITTNNQYRELQYFHDLPSEDQEDYSDMQESQFFEYRGIWYPTGHFFTLSDSYWDGVMGIGNSNSLYIKLSDCGDAVIVGRD